MCISAQLSLFTSLQSDEKNYIKHILGMLFVQRYVALHGFFDQFHKLYQKMMQTLKESDERSKLTVALQKSIADFIDTCTSCFEWLWVVWVIFKMCLMVMIK